MPRGSKLSAYGKKYVKAKNAMQKKRSATSSYVPVILKRSKRMLPAMEYGQTPEIKAIDFPVAGGPQTSTFRIIGTPPPPFFINAIQVGSAYYNRIGSKINMKNLHIRGLVTAIATSVQDIGRILVVYDRSPNGAAPPLTTVLSSRDQLGNQTQTGLSEVNLDYRDRFAILRDYEIPLPAQTFTGGVLTNGPDWPGNMERIDVNIFIPLKGLLAHYKASSNPAVIGDCSVGAIFLYVLSTFADSEWNFNWSARLRYDDL